MVRSGFLEADRLLVTPSALLREYCLSPITTIYRVDDRQFTRIPLPTTAAGELNEATIAQVKQAREAWFVVNGKASTHRQVEADVMATLVSRRLPARVTIRREFGELLVFRVRLGPSRKSNAGRTP